MLITSIVVEHDMLVEQTQSLSYHIKQVEFQCCRSDLRFGCLGLNPASLSLGGPGRRNGDAARHALG